MSDVARIDEQYYQVVPTGSLSERVLIAARDGIHRDFVAAMAPTSDDTILDVGVSDVVGPGANGLERLHPHAARITAVGLGEGYDFRRAYPVVTYRRIEPHARLPFDDGQFDVAFSNAVIEHLGTVENQRRFLSEMARVSRRAFAVVPNRYFPVEHHTALPMAGWWNRSFALACRATGKTEWSEPANLILMCRGRLRALCPADRPARIGYTGLRMGRCSSNLYVAIGG